MAIIKPINKYTEYVIEDDGSKAYRVYNKMSPHYYMDKTGSLNPINIKNIQTITKASVGEIKLREKNVVSTGLRTDGNKTKYLGMRPDETQEDGTHQLEWTIEEAIINNVTQSITLNQTNEIDDITTNLGGQVVQSTRHFTRQMVPVTGSITNFKVKYKLHLTGLQISNSKDDGTGYYTSDNGEFKIKDGDNNVQFRITEPVLLDSDLNIIQHISQSFTTGSKTHHTYISNPTTHTLKDNGDGTYEYIKYPSEDLLKTEITSSVRYIDATTTYGAANLDGVVGYSNNQPWLVTHASSAGTTAYSSVHYYNTAVYVSRIGFFFSSFYGISRAFFAFDTSDINTTPLTAAFKVKMGPRNDLDLIVLEATHTTINTDTYNDFTGWDADFDIDNGEGVKYTDEISKNSLADNGYFSSIGLNSTALTAINDNDTTKLCVMSHDFDAKNQAPASQPTTDGTHFYFSDTGGVHSDPHLYLLMEKSIPDLHILSGNLKLNSGTLIIK